MDINISTAEDIQYYMNELQKDETEKNVVRTDKYDEEKLTNFVPVYQIVRWIDELRKSNDMWRYAVDECFGMLEDAITSNSEPEVDNFNKKESLTKPSPKDK